MPNRGVGKTLSPTRRGAILALRFSDRKNGPTVRQIADLLNLPKSTHCQKRERESRTERERCRIIAHYLRYPIHHRRCKHGAGKQIVAGDRAAEPANRVVAGDAEQPEVPLTRLLAEEEVPLSELLAAAKPRVSTGRPQALSEQEKDILEVTGFNHVSLMTILNALHERGIKAYREEFKFILKPENKVQRLVYCQERKDWRPDKEWARYGFTDEMSIEIGGTFGISRVWRSNDEKYEEDCRGATKKNKATVMVWGMIKWGYKVTKLSR
ncbi:hypothetical protein FN846DRAFT_966290 [Sphaerosporella brunnea]|uniref:Uncharacterized protein n=1 Tax=Sphaerosporella brunnea TaxID=1250544 RepID=A0A5J5ELX1_9PEZI|nr:hypothetical protein FN846DRAFT_966290 [Sphaerosporella brunnea]